MSRLETRLAPFARKVDAAASRVTGLLLLGLLLALPGAPGVARAQAADDAAADERAGIERIVVTAQRRERTLQETPISITAFGESELEERGIENAIDLTDFVPNVNVQVNANGSGLFVSSRGIAQADATLITREPAVAMYIDGVYWGMTNGALLDVLDLERVEVLRGPQGDLYGRNSSAGAINFITRKPSGSYGTKVSGKYGRFDTGEIRAYQEFPILGGEGHAVSDAAGTLSGSMSFYGANRDAYYRNDFDNDIDERERFAGRTALRYEREALEVLASFDISHFKEQGPEMELTQTYVSPGDFFGVKGILDPFLVQGRDNQLQVDGSAGAVYLGGPTVMGPFLPSAGLKDDETLNLGTNLTVSYDWGDVPALGEAETKLIVGYRKLKDDTFQDRDGSPVDVFSNALYTRQWQFHLEPELIGATDVGIGSLDYLLGYFFFTEEGRQDAIQFAFTDPMFMLGAVGTRQFPEIDNTAHAIFGHFAFTPAILEDRLRLEFGIRQTWEKKRVESEQFNLNPASPSYPKTRFSEKFQELTPSGRISFLVNDELTVFGAISKGYLAGGFNGRAAFPTAAAAMMAGAPPSTALDFNYDEETVVSYEAGFKFQGFDDRVRLNASGFFMDYDDLQRTQLLAVPGTVFSGVNNAGKAEIWGTEVELEVLPCEGLNLAGTFGMALAEYKEFLDFDPMTMMLRDFADERKFANTPRYNYTLSAKYTLPPFGFGTLSGRVDWYWQSRTTLQNGDNPGAEQSPYGLLHARLTLAELDLGAGKLGEIDLSIWGRNLLDREYKPFGIDFLPNSGGTFPFTVQYYGERRTVGAELIWRFGAMI